MSHDTSMGAHSSHENEQTANGSYMNANGSVNVGYDSMTNTLRDASGAPGEVSSSSSGSSSAATGEKKGNEVYGCEHYSRRCKVVSPCCKDVFWCRHCHNHAKNVLESDPKKAHEMDRHAVTKIICAVCDTRQSPSNRCVTCGVEFAQYFCKVCNFWDDRGLEKKIFHCESCGICRVGGRENFFHCDTCGSCYPVSIQNQHHCVERAMHQDCPVCLENLFQSTKPVSVLNCGHTIHQACLEQLTKDFWGLSSLRCPICAVSIGTSTSLWSNLDRQIEETPMPPELLFQVKIVCNDCVTRGEAPFHIIGLKCHSCGSYNTRRVQ